jgi:tetratricopeptide (TPR) repeat protein
MNRTALIALLITLPTVVAANKTAAPTPAADPADSATRATEILAAIEKGGTKDEQLARIDDLVTISPTAVNTLVTFLKRDHATAVDERRKVLTNIGAAVPDRKGRFRSPGRESSQTKEEADAFDWATNLLEKGGKTRATREALADVAALRALARSEDPRGGLAALEFSFGEGGDLYRDEVGRYLRKGAPWSIPGLIRGAHAKDADQRRYADYQLERIDRQAPHKAIRAAAISEALQIEVFKAFADTLYREAIYTVLDNVDHNVEPVRAAARETLQAYVTREPTRQPPKRRLTLPGGKLTSVRQPLWLSHKELAAIELRNRLEQITGAAPAENTPLAELARQFLAHHDTKRLERLTVTFDAGRKAFGSGDTAAAIRKFDEVLAQEPDFPKRAEMVEAYLAHGKKLLDAGDNQEAVVALTKATALDPSSAKAKEARVKTHLARARLIEAAGGDAAAELARAKEIDPGAGDSSGARWMLFLGIGGGLAGVFLLLAGALIRRRR